VGGPEITPLLLKDPSIEVSKHPNILAVLYAPDLGRILSSLHQYSERFHSMKAKRTLSIGKRTFYFQPPRALSEFSDALFASSVSVRPNKSTISRRVVNGDPPRGLQQRCQADAKVLTRVRKFLKILISNMFLPVSSGSAIKKSGTVEVVYNAIFMHGPGHR
jgi:hypothetical protein